MNQMNQVSTTGGSVFTGSLSGVPYNPPPKVSALEEFRNEVEQAHKALTDLTLMARQIADSVFGVIPEPGEVNRGQGIVSITTPPRVDALRYGLSSLHGQIAQLRSQIERLTCV